MKTSRTDFRRGDVRREVQHGRIAVVYVEQAVANRELTSELRLQGGGEGRRLLVTDVNPFDPSIPAYSVSYKIPR